MSITIDKTVFPNEQSVIKHLCAMREKYGCNENISLASSDGRFLSSLIRRSTSWPYRFISGLVGFKTGRFATRNQSGFSWVDRVGSSVQFSYRECVRGQDPLPIQIELHAAQKAISAQLVQFREQKHCDNCKVPLTRRLTSHLPPRTFLHLWDRFNEYVPAFCVTPEERLPPDIETCWQIYHRRHAVLRSLCVRCFYQSPENRY